MSGATMGFVRFSVDALTTGAAFTLTESFLLRDAVKLFTGTLAALACFSTALATPVTFSLSSCNSCRSALILWSPMSGCRLANVSDGSSSSASYSE